MSGDLPVYVTVDTRTLSEKVSEYVAAMEQQRTNDWCKCEWIVHPADEKLDIHNCGNCHHPQLLHITDEANDEYRCTSSVGCKCNHWADPPKRRMRRGDQDPECPVHTKEGFLLGFFDWAHNAGQLG